MDDIQAVIGCSIKLQEFINIELFVQGYYQVRIYPKLSNGMAIQEKLDVHHKSGETPTDVESNIQKSNPTVACSEILVVIYKQEEFQLHDQFNFEFTVAVNCMELVKSFKNLGMCLVVELWYGDRSESPTSLALQCARTFHLMFDPRTGLSVHLPVLFDYFHLCMVRFTCHMSLLAIVPVHTVSSEKLQQSTAYSVLFGIDMVETNEITPEGKQRARTVCQSICNLLFLAYESLYEKSKSMCEDLVEDVELMALVKQNIKAYSKTSKSAFQTLMLMFKNEGKVENIEGLAHQEITRCAAQNILLWNEFLENLAFHQCVVESLILESEKLKDVRFTECFFYKSSSRSRALNLTLDAQLSLFELVRSSPYGMQMFPMPMECPELHGTRDTLPVIIEECYKAVDRAMTVATNGTKEDIEQATTKVPPHSKTASSSGIVSKLKSLGLRDTPLVRSSSQQIDRSNRSDGNVKLMSFRSLDGPDAGLKVGADHVTASIDERGVLATLHYHHSFEPSPEHIMATSISKSDVDKKPSTQKSHKSRQKRPPTKRGCFLLLRRGQEKRHRLRKISHRLSFPSRHSTSFAVSSEFYTSTPDLGKALYDIEHVRTPYYDTDEMCDKILYRRATEDSLADSSMPDLEELGLSELLDSFDSTESSFISKPDEMKSTKTSLDDAEIKVDSCTMCKSDFSGRCGASCEELDSHVTAKSASSLKDSISETRDGLALLGFHTQRHSFYTYRLKWFLKNKSQFLAQCHQRNVMYDLYDPKTVENDRNTSIFTSLERRGGQMDAAGSMKCVDPLCLFSTAAQDGEDEEESVHMIVCVHGLDGDRSDLRLFRTFLQLTQPHEPYKFLMSSWNQNSTFGDFSCMVTNLVNEINEFIQKRHINPVKMSFVGHSLGNIVIRALIADDRFAPYISRLHTFLSLGGPHLGTMFGTHGIVNFGLWVMQKWKKSASLLQISFKDKPNIKKTFMYQLSKTPCFQHFKNVLLVASPQDHYAPFHSARIEACKAALKDNVFGSVYVEMVSNLMAPIIKNPSINFVRYTVFHHSSSVASELAGGRSAHIAALDSEVFVEKLIRISVGKYFR